MSEELRDQTPPDPNTSEAVEDSQNQEETYAPEPDADTTQPAPEEAGDNSASWMQKMLEGAGQAAQDPAVSEAVQQVMPAMQAGPEVLPETPPGTETALPQGDQDLEQAEKDAEAREEAKTNPTSELHPDKKATEALPDWAEFVVNNPEEFAKAWAREYVTDDFAKFQIDPWIEAIASGTPADHWRWGARSMPDNLWLVGSVGEGIHKGIVEGYNFGVDIHNATTEDPNDYIETFDSEEFYGAPEGMADSIFQGVGQVMTWFIPIAGTTSRVTRGLTGLWRFGGGSLFRNRGGKSIGDMVRYGSTYMAGSGAAVAVAFDPSKGNVSTVLNEQFDGKSWSAARNFFDKYLFEPLDSTQYTDDPKTRIYGRLASATEDLIGVKLIDDLIGWAGRSFGWAKQTAGPRVASATQQVREGAEAIAEETGVAPVLQGIKNLAYDTLMPETKVAIRNTYLFTVARMKRAQELYDSGVKMSNIPAQLEYEGFGLKDWQIEHLIPAMGRLMTETFDMGLDQAEELMDQFVRHNGQLTSVFIGGGPKGLGARQVMASGGGRPGSIRVSLLPDEKKFFDDLASTPEGKKQLEDAGFRILDSGLLEARDKESMKDFVEQIASAREASGEVVPPSFGKGDFGNDAKPILYSRTNAHAEVDFDTGVAFIRGFNGADAVDAADEFGHALHAQLFASKDESLKKAMNEAFDIGPEGWTTGPGGKMEDFSGAFKNIAIRWSKDPSSIPPKKRQAVARLVAEMRDIYIDTKGNAPGVGRLKPHIKEFFEDLARRTDLPIRYAPGRYIDPIDWSTLAGRIADWAAKGIDWRDKLKPEDMLAVARIKKPGNRQGPGNVRPGLDPDRVRSGNPEDPTIVGSYPPDASISSNTWSTEEELQIMVAAYQDLSRYLYKENVNIGKVTWDEVEEQGLKLVNDWMGRDPLELEATINQFLREGDPRDKAARMHRVFALNTIMRMQGEKVLKARRMAQKLQTPMAMATFQRDWIQFQWLQANVATMRSSAGAELSAWRMPAHLPTDEVLKDEATSRAFLRELGQTTETGQRLLQLHASIGDGPEAYKRLAQLAAQDTSSKFFNSVSWLKDFGVEMFSQWLLSGPRTIFGLSLVSPAVMMGMDGLATSIGALAKGDIMGAKEPWENLTRFKLLNATKMGLRAMKEEQSVLMPQANMLEDSMRLGTISPERLNTFLPKAMQMDPDSHVSKIVNAIGKGSRSPGLGIQFFDEIYRQSGGRMASMAKSYRDEMNRIAKAEMENPLGAISETSTSSEIHKWMQTRHDQVLEHVQVELDRTIKDGRLRTERVIEQEIYSDPEILALEGLEQLEAVQKRMEIEWTQNPRHVEMVKYVEERAVEPVFQTPFKEGSVGKYVQGLLDHPNLKGFPRYIVPFLRTPWMILERAFDYSPTATIAEGAERAAYRMTNGPVKIDDRMVPVGRREAARINMALKNNVLPERMHERLSKEIAKRWHGEISDHARRVYGSPVKSWNRNTIPANRLEPPEHITSWVLEQSGGRKALGYPRNWKPGEVSETQNVQMQMLMRRAMEHVQHADLERRQKLGVESQRWNPGQEDIMGGFHRRHLEAMRSPEANIRNRALGRQMMGLGIIYSTYELWSQGAFRGATPGTKEGREAWKNAGYVANSVDLSWIPGFEGGQASIMRLDPGAIHTLVIVNTLELMHSQEGLTEDQEINLFTGLLYSTMEQLENKSYIQGLGDMFKAMEDPTRYADNWFQNVATSATPFSSFSRNLLDTLDPVQRDMIDIWDAYTGRTMFGFGETDELPPRYTPIGEVMYKAPRFREMARRGETPGADFLSYFNFVSPVYVGFETDDPVYLGLAEMDRHIGPPRSEIRGLDMRSYQNGVNEHSAYHRYQELTGEVTLKGKFQVNGKIETREYTLYDLLHNYWLGGKEGDPAQGDLADLRRLHELQDAEGTMLRQKGVSAKDAWVKDQVETFRDAALKQVMEEYPMLERDLVTKWREYAEELRPSWEFQFNDERKGWDPNNGDSKRVRQLDKVIERLKGKEAEYDTRQLQPVQP
tara:strand:+ start:11149 stop:17232 length:6084 start_codon:yes stop_codon:yes gene_type:complete